MDLILTPDELQQLTSYKRQESAMLGAFFGSAPEDLDGMGWREWFDMHHKRFLLPLEEIAASRIPYAWNDDDCEGVYFLFDQDELQYVGQSVRIAERLHKHVYPHWNRKPVPWVTHYAALWVPTNLLDCVEGYYIHTLRPPRNVQYRTPHAWILPYLNAKPL